MPKKIIVIEDEPLLLKALNIELLSANYEVMSATNGQSGLKLVQKELPDLVLLDLILPKLSGYEVLRTLKEGAKTKAIPIIILSNLSQKDEMKRGLELGAEDYFIKSNTGLDQIAEKIKKLLK